MWIKINADSLLTMPDIGSGMESYRNFIGISKISAYGQSKQNIRNWKAALLLKNFPVQQPLQCFKNFISTYFFQTCHLLLKIKLMKKFRLPLKVRINIDTKQTGHLLLDVSKQYFLKSCVIFSIYLQLIAYIRNLSDADLRLCLEEHSDERRIKQ